jgi:hypothetical protein
VRTNSLEEELFEIGKKLKKLMKNIYPTKCLFTFTVAALIKRSSWRLLSEMAKLNYNLASEVNLCIGPLQSADF